MRLINMNNYNEVLANAKEVLAGICNVCPDCNGVACKGKVPGVGAKGSGSSFTVCREYLKNDRLSKMIYDVIENSLDKEKVSMSEECFFYMKIPIIGIVIFFVVEQYIVLCINHLEINST